MKKLLWTLSALSLMGLGLVGCGDADEGDECTQSTDCLSDANPNMVCARDGICRTADCGGDACIDGETCHPADKIYTGVAACKRVQLCPEGQWLNAENLCEKAEASSCKEDGDCNEGEHCNDGVCEPGDGDPVYKFVRIQDLSSNKTTTKEDPGADIDAIALTKAADPNDTTYAVGVRGFARSDGTSSNPDKTIAATPEKALGAPDAFVSYASTGKGDGTCNYRKDGNKDNEYTFVSLGGLGGYLIVEMAKAIENGDTLTVFELGECKLNGTNDNKHSTAGAEKMKVSVSVSESTEGDWRDIGDYEATSDNKGVIAGKVSGL